MFVVGEYIVYGTTGVCKVEEIGPMQMMGPSKDKLYYTLAPLYSKGSKVFIPVDNEKVVMRPVLTKEEAEELVNEIPSIELLWVADEKSREDIYKTALRSCEPKEWIKIIKTLYLRKMSLTVTFFPSAIRDIFLKYSVLIIFIHSFGSQLLSAVL